MKGLGPGDERREEEEDDTFFVNSIPEVPWMFKLIHCIVNSHKINNSISGIIT
jgi:hypothetical protein